jgi:hypothetical protein
MAYWPNPQMTPDTRTVTFSLAFDSTTQENGCIRYVPQSGLSKELRPHIPVSRDRGEGHAIATRVSEEERVEYAEVGGEGWRGEKGRLNQRVFFTSASIKGTCLPPTPTPNNSTILSHLSIYTTSLSLLSLSPPSMKTLLSL